MSTGEDEKGLRQIIDFTRLISIFILVVHFYLSCYQAYSEWGWTAAVTDRLIINLTQTGIFDSLLRPKLAALLLLLVSLIGSKGRKDEMIKKNTIIVYSLTGAVLYFASALIFYAPVCRSITGVFYILLTSTGYMLILTAGGLLSRLIKVSLNDDIFNDENETFPQEERLLENEYSINLPAIYKLGKELRKSFINVINPFRGLLVSGTPGAGKSYFVIRHIIDQHIRKGFSMFIYDFKFDDLSKIAFNKLRQYSANYKVMPSFFVINFDNLNRTHRCNPLDPQAMEDLTDATEASRTIMMGLNRDWLKKQGDFFVESPINFLTACILDIMLKLAI